MAHHQSLVRLSAGVLPAAFIVVWSSGYLVGSIGARSGPPLALLFWRLLLAFVVLGVVALATRAPWPSQPRVYVHLVVTGVLLQTLQFGPIYLGLGMGVTPGMAAMIVSACPLVVAAAAVPLFAERMTCWQWLGLGVGLFGVVISLSDKLGGRGTLTGYTLIALGLLGFAAGTLYQKRFGQSVDLRTGTTIQLLAGLITTLPLAALHGGVALPLTFPAVGSSVWLALVNSIGGFTMLFLLLRLRSGGAATSLLYLVPPVTAVLSMLVLGQNTPATVFAGMSVSGAGVLLVVFAKRRVAGVGSPP
ncbi:DMT family transporter [Actinophytocola sp.]|uniref:DMT family transporter n=1 Tax=Actinophytocola sp. TaxID=1872138 RepID=UPI002ED19428